MVGIMLPRVSPGFAGLSESLIGLENLGKHSGIGAGGGVGCGAFGGAVVAHPTSNVAVSKTNHDGVDCMLKLPPKSRLLFMSLKCNFSRCLLAVSLTSQ